MTILRAFEPWFLMVTIITTLHWAQWWHDTLKGRKRSAKFSEEFYTKWYQATGELEGLRICKKPKSELDVMRVLYPRGVWCIDGDGKAVDCRIYSVEEKNELGSHHLKRCYP